MFFKTPLLVFLIAFFLFSFSEFYDLKTDFKKNSPSYIVGFYNVENLFDTIDDPRKNDNAFLPGSKKKWTGERYHKKLNDIAKVIYTIDSTNLPVVFGLAEVENKAVVQDLIDTKNLKGKYQVIHKESPDSRGIDVAVIYQPKKFNLIHKEWIRIQLPNKERPSTRDMVYVKGTILKKDTLHFFFCHWPSRWGGEEKTRPYRKKAATELRNKVDSLKSINKNAKIIIMGDLNDHPNDESVYEVLNAKKAVKNSDLINLMIPFVDKEEGTHFYKGHWGVLDHIIASNALYNANKGLKVHKDGAQIHKKDWMLYTNKNGVSSPSRTYGGNNYYGGYSDHLAVFVRLTK